MFQLFPSSGAISSQQPGHQEGDQEVLLQHCPPNLLRLHSRQKKPMARKVGPEKKLLFTAWLGPVLPLLLNNYPSRASPACHCTRMFCVRGRTLDIQ